MLVNLSRCFDGGVVVYRFEMKLDEPPYTRRRMQGERQEGKWKEDATNSEET